MPREIKFRFWSNHLGKFVVPMDNIFAGALKDPSMNPMQFTGIKDSASKEIYEGDVVMLTLTNLKYMREAVVEYRAPEWVLRYKGDFQPLKEWHNYPDRWIQVKGNIYENAEATNAIL